MKCVRSKKRIISILKVEQANNKKKAPINVSVFVIKQYAKCGGTIYKLKLPSSIVTLSSEKLYLF